MTCACDMRACMVCGVCMYFVCVCLCVYGCVCVERACVCSVSVCLV